MSDQRPLAALILAAGRGERMNSELVKVLHRAAGQSLVEHVLDSVDEVGAKKVAVVIGTQSNQIRSFLQSHPLEFVLQKQRLGTAHAVMQADRQFRHWWGDILVLPADAPCIQGKTLEALIREHRKNGAVATILTADLADPQGYGRILRDGDQVIGIREELDASDGERRIGEINSGIYVFDSRRLFQQLSSIKKNQKKKEFYLTDVIERFVNSNLLVKAYKLDDPNEILGVNTRQELSTVHKIMNAREIQKHMNAGVTILDPDQTSIAKNVKIGRDTVIHPFTWIESDVVIGEQCEIGPFAKIRSGSKIADEVVIGSFVEVVRTKLGSKTLVKHLTYLGDSVVGKKVNIGAGTITANYDGKNKNKTVIKDGAFIGSDTVLIAPVTVGKHAKTGAGTILPARRNVPAGETVFGIPAKVKKKK